MKLSLCLIALTAAVVMGQQEDEFFDANPQYTFSYKIASDDTQTYINQDESRDGERVNGEYSFVDPNGDLITVVYTAGPEGYSETRNVQKGFVTIDPSNIGAPAPVRPSARTPRPAPRQSSQPGFNEDKIIQRIVGGLAPVIEESVSIGLDS